MASGVSQQLPVHQPPSSIAVQLVLLSAAVALQVVAVTVLVKLLLQKSRAQEHQQLAEERQGLTADPADGRSSVEIRDSQKESDVLRPRTEGHDSSGSPWLAPRHRVVVGCCFGGFICYADRTNMSVAIVSMREQFGWDAAVEGLVLGSFFYGYTLTQIVGGLAARRYGGRVVLLTGVGLWSLFTLLTPLAAASGMTPLILCRVLMGLGEGVTMPSVHALIGEWLPPEERTRSIAIATSGQFLGTITAMGSSPLAAVDWAAVFYFFGALGYVYILACVLFMPSERGTYGDAGCGSEPAARMLGKLRVLLKSKSMWAIIIANSAHNYGWFVALSWLPQYFSDLGVTLSAVGVYAVMPYLSMFVFETAWSTFIESFGLNQGRLSLLAVRRVSQLVAFWVPATVIGLMLVVDVSSTPWLASAFLSVALGANMASHSGYWANMIDIAPGDAGIVCGLSNTISTLPGAYGNSLTGWVLNTTNSWVWVFGVAIGHWTVGALVFLRWSSVEKAFI